MLILLAFLLVSPTTVAAAEDFDLFIVPTVDDRLDSWLKLPPQLKPTIHQVETIYPNQPFSLRLLFKKYARSDQGNAHITYDVAFIDPDGQVTEDKGIDLLGYRGPVKSDNYIITNQQLLQVYFDQHYPLGTYEIRATARDRIAQKTVTRKTTISLAAFTRTGNFVSLDFFNFWMRNHYQKPDVAKSIFGILQFIKADPEWLRENRKLVSFARLLMKKNPWVRDHLFQIFRKQPAAREAIITLLTISHLQAPEPGLAAQKQLKQEIGPLHDTGNDKEGLTPADIDDLWANFYVYGNLEPIEEIVRLLKPFALSEPPTPPEELDDVSQLAFWTLIDHGKTNPLVVNYCSLLLDYSKKLQPETKIQLKLALDVIEKSLLEQQKN